MDNVYFPSMDIADVPESGNAGIDPQSNFSHAGEQLPSANYFTNSFGSTNEDWDSILGDFTNDSCLQDPSTFNTSLPSTSPVTSTSFRNTPDTVVSNACVNGSGPREGADDTIAPPETDFKRNTSEGDLQQQAFTLAPDLPPNGFHQLGTDSVPHFVTATSQIAGMGAGTIVCSAATLGTPQTESTLVMNASPRHRVSRLPPDIGVDGQIRYLEPHEMPESTSEIIQYDAGNATEGNTVLPPELEKHMYYPPGQEPNRQQQIAPQMQMQQVQQVQAQPLQSQHSQHIPGPKQYQYFQQPQYAMGSHNNSNQQFYGQHPRFIQDAQQPQQPQHGSVLLPQQIAMTPHQAQHQKNFKNIPQFPNAAHFQSGMHAGPTVAQQARQSIPPGRGHVQVHPVTQDQNLELYYTADGYKSYSPRAEKPPNTNSHEWLRNRDFRSTWNLGDVYTNWLGTSPNTVEPHVKPFLKKDIKLGMSSQDATKAAITDGFVRGAGWAAKLFLTQIEKEMRESGTMLGYRPHKKVQKAELEQSVIDHIVRTNPPSIHGAQCANVIAWAYDEFYPGVFRQEGSNGKPRGPKEIFEAWKTLGERISTDQLKPVLFDTSTGMTVMTDIQPSRPPVAQVRSFAAQTGQEPAIRIAQFPVPDAKNGRVAVSSGENFFTNPEGPATMKLQQMRRAESMASRSISKPQGARQAPKTAEEKKENRNRKADEKIGWTLTGQSRTIQHEHMTAVSYQCSDGEFRILEGQRLEEAKERTLMRFRQQQGARAMVEAGTNAPSMTTTGSSATVPTGAEPNSRGQAASLSVDGTQGARSTLEMDSSAGHQSTNKAEVRRKRAPDEESMPSARRKKGRQEAQQGLGDSRTGKEMLFPQPLDMYSGNKGHFTG